ncbi:MAG: PD40 domain-containing protein [Bacteroidales bacterium]|nr:PD40 domain-containing protein [Bacteroidales bacterium]
MRKILPLVAVICLLLSCQRGIEVSDQIDALPPVEPDYAGVTVPVNIAPLNFSYLGTEPCALQVGGQTIRGRKGLFRFSRKQWKRLMARPEFELTVLARKEGKWVAYKPFKIFVSQDRIDPYISYRLIPPGYQGWQKMGLYQRDLESYRQTPIVTNDLTGGNCMNCHTYLNGDPSKMVFHARATFGGTMLIDGGAIEKLNTKTDSTMSALVYPYWHPSGDYIAFSVNKTFQSFYNHGSDRIEVFDKASDVVVYNVHTRQIAWSPLTRDEGRFETFPTFSPDGKWLYFCSAEAVPEMPKDYKQARYGIYRIAFHAEDMSFGDQLECIYDAPAEGFSASFPRISPDGRYLCFTRHGYGNFSIWHQDSDLWMVDLETRAVWPLAEANSERSESFHTWSGNGRWLVFNSRRGDGLYTRVYFTHIDADGRASKAFLLPQDDPVPYYKRLLFSYNLPAFMTGPVPMPERRIVSEIRRSQGVDVQVKD